MADKKETAKPDKAAHAETPVEGGGEQEKAQSHKKINKMTLVEIDAKLNEIKSTQGGLRSRYAKQLFLRKKTLGN